MSEHKSDDELLSDAIPIPEDELEELEEADDDELEPIEFDDADDDDEDHTSQIRMFGAKKRELSRWKRQPTNSGKGAAHVRTFVTKLRLDAVEHLDEQINEWLDEHPDFDVKFVTTSIGPLVGKNIENALFVNVWV